MLEGRCKLCNRKYYGWALKNQKQRICECGGEIDIVQTGQTSGQTRIIFGIRHEQQCIRYHRQYSTGKNKQA